VYIDCLSFFLFVFGLPSGHNKPEAFWLFAQSDPSIAQRRHLVYVEDCADHVLNFEHAFRRVFSLPTDISADNVNVNDDNSDKTKTSNSSPVVDAGLVPAAAPVAAEAEADVLSGVDASQFAFEDATLLFWPPAPEDGFETLERHSADAHERLIARCTAK
jgi:hypothetical protein